MVNSNTSNARCVVSIQQHYWPNLPVTHPGALQQRAQRELKAISRSFASRGNSWWMSPRGCLCADASARVATPSLRVPENQKRHLPLVALPRRLWPQQTRAREYENRFGRIKFFFLSNILQIFLLNKGDCKAGLCIRAPVRNGALIDVKWVRIIWSSHCCANKKTKQSQTWLLDRD